MINGILYFIIIGLGMWLFARPWKGGAAHFFAFYLVLLFPAASIIFEEKPGGALDFESILMFVIWCLFSLMALLKLRITENEGGLLLFWKHTDMKGEGNEREEQIGALLKWLLALLYALFALSLLLYGPVNLSG